MQAEHLTRSGKHIFFVFVNLIVYILCFQINVPLSELQSAR